MTGQSTAPSITSGAGAAHGRGGAGDDGTGAAGPGPPRVQTRLLRGARPRKRWRYVAVFCDELMACAALVRIGPARQSFWALYDRGTGALLQRTRMLPRASEVTIAAGRGAQPGRVRIADRGIVLDLTLAEQPGVQALCGHAGTQVWTRKQAGVSAQGTLTRDGGAAQPLRAAAVIDDTCGHHARVTEWRWSAGVGEAPDGRALAWNLVAGVNDPPTGSERAVWVDGEPFEPAPVRFADDLSQIAGAGGELLRFEPEAERARRDNLLVVSSSYRAPFGTFAGTLPGGASAPAPLELARGSGVMEHHRARW